MGYVPGRKADLFLSYAHAEQEWSNQFRERLCQKLQERLGAAVEIWQDRQKIMAANDWGGRIQDAVRDAAIFVAICSPSYFHSEWCDDERETFLCGQPLPPKFKEYYRFLKVLKAPSPDASHEDFLKEIEPLRFFPEKDLKHEGYPLQSDDYNVSLRNTANALHEILRALRNSYETVYVARTNQEIRADRYELIRQLEGYAFNTVSLGPNFSDERLRATMEPATFCVFPVGSEHDEYFQRQLDAARYLEKRILVWIAPAREKQSTGRQLEFIERIKKDSATAWRGSLTVSDFTRDLQLWLNPAPTPPAEKQVYLMHERSPWELLVAQQLRLLMTGSGVTVAPQEDIRPPDELAQRPRLLRESDGILIYRGQTQGFDDWLHRALGSALLAERPKALATLASRPPDSVPGFQVLPFTPPPTPELLRPFLDQLTKARSAFGSR